MQELLPAICSIAGDVFVFQQDSALQHIVLMTQTSLFAYLLIYLFIYYYV